MGQGNCPPWCAEHVAGGAQHRATVGDVRLTLTGDDTTARVVFSVRRRAARTPAEMAELAADLAEAGSLLRPAGSRRVAQGYDRRGPVTAVLASV